ncbi:MAG: hypothetical protein K0R00_3118 [Herbinix sp.]|jgi:hypothetical protein|nr:hypothetical protein [Anaerocolumna sp.]MDF2844692.1 hypothetical protein [Herbinix sp.]
MCYITSIIIWSINISTLLINSQEISIKKYPSLFNHDKNFKMLVSNYRDRTNLYDKYLCEHNGWNSLEYETKTTVGGSRDNNRTEILWYNY